MDADSTRYFRKILIAFPNQKVDFKLVSDYVNVGKLRKYFHVIFYIYEIAEKYFDIEPPWSGLYQNLMKN